MLIFFLLPCPFPIPSTTHPHINSPFLCLQATNCGSSCLSWPLIPIKLRRLRSWSMIRNSSFISALCCCRSLSAFSFRMSIFCWASSLRKENWTVSSQKQIRWVFYNLEYKNLSWVWGADRKIRPEGQCSAKPRDAEHWSQGTDFSICTEHPWWILFLEYHLIPNFYFDLSSHCDAWICCRLPLHTDVIVTS